MLFLPIQEQEKAKLPRQNSDIKSPRKSDRKPSARGEKSDEKGGDVYHLIDYIRNMQKQHARNTTAVPHKVSSTNRVMTTMAPSASEKLRRDIRSFSLERQNLEASERLLPKQAMNLGNLLVPSYTKNAYIDNQFWNKRRR